MTDAALPPGTTRAEFYTGRYAEPRLVAVASEQSLTEALGERPARGAPALLLRV